MQERTMQVEQITQALKYIFFLVIDWFAFLVLVAIFFGLSAPYLALKLIRRNRPLGRDIYREIAQADRFMEVWTTGSRASNESQYINAFVTNGNSQAANNSRIDEELRKENLVEKYPNYGMYGGSTYFVRPKKGYYLVRNWLVFLLLLWLRVSFFGDKYSHIEIIGEKYQQAELKRMYWETFILILSTAFFIVTLTLKILI